MTKESPAEKKKKKSGAFTTILLVFVLIAGLSLVLYPTVSDKWNSMHSSQIVASYSNAVASFTEQEYERIWNDAVEYNRKLYENKFGINTSEEQMADYNAQLNIGGNGVMGYIEIPSIDVTLPIYHGTEEGVLQIASGHIEWSSLPVGGLNTHCALSGHRGLPSAKLFTDLDEMKNGDTFRLNILNETLTYEVDQIRTVLPQEVDKLTIVPEQDYCTLVTCTPYGINTHRYLVRGHRIANQVSDVHVTPDGVVLEPMLVAPLLMIPFLLLLFILVLFRKPRKKFDPKSITIERTPL